MNERPCSQQFSCFQLAYAELDKTTGIHDIFELFGGVGNVTKVAVRRKLKSGRNFDIVCDIDLTKPSEVNELWHYVVKHKPKVLIAAPPCTSFGPWSRFNRVHHYDTWAASRKTGIALAELTAELCMHQFTHGFHFLIENPWSSEMWELPSFVRLADACGHWAYCEQCSVGLCDPDGIPTKKPTAFLGSCEAIVHRLRRTCLGGHEHIALAGQAHGISRCRFAQSWPRKLVELVVDGAVECLHAMKHALKAAAYPARAVPQDDGYGGKVCPGCKAHARNDDPRHSREPNVCKFPQVESREWDCLACRKHLPSTHSTHKFDDSCQWTHARSRAASSRTPALLRDPRVPRAAPVAADDAPEPIAPPGIANASWKPVSDLEMITTLDMLRENDGWHQVDALQVACVLGSARAFRSCEPRFPAAEWNKRSTFGMFPECNHAHGIWWQIEDQIHFSEPLYALRACIVNPPVPVLVHIFHKLPSAPTINNTRSAHAVPPQNPAPNPLDEVVAKWDLEEELGAEEPVIPPAVEAPAPDDGQPPEVVDWSSFDLGRSLRALRSEDPAIQARALKRLHLRFWHASSDKMTRLLKSAGVPTFALNLIHSVCTGCKACRAWQRPGNRSIATTRISDHFGECVQFDLLFISDHIVAVLIDEATRWTVAEQIPDREAETLLRFITDRWIRIFGPITTLLSDQEGGLTGEQFSIWCERHGVAPRFKPKGAHAAIVERHHQMLRDTVHKVTTQAQLEKLELPFPDALSESVFSKNSLMNIAGYSPFQSLFGRFPACLIDLETAGQSAIEDGKGGVAGASRHAIRVREIALEAMLASHAKARMQRAENSNSRPAGELLSLVPGDSVDVYRSPAQKDLSGWRGPCEVISTRSMANGVIDIRWSGRTLTARVQDIRRTSIYCFLTEDGEPPIEVLRTHVMAMSHGIQTLAWVVNERGWQLSHAALDYPVCFLAILHVAAELGITRCVGARVGRGCHHVSGLMEIVSSVVLWWPAGKPALYQTLEHAGSMTINLKQLFAHEEFTDFCWVQFLSTDVINARRLRRLNPHKPQLAFDPNDEDQPHYDEEMTEPPTRRPSIASMDDDDEMPPRPPYHPSPMPSSHRSPVSTRQQSLPSPVPTHRSLPSPMRIPVHTDRSRTSRGARSPVASSSAPSTLPPAIPPLTTSTMRVPSESEPSVVNTRSTIHMPSSVPSSLCPLNFDKRALPSDASSSHRPHKQAHVPNFQQGGSSSSSGPAPAPAPTADGDEDEDEVNVDFYCDFGDGGIPYHIYTTGKGEVVVEKVIGELTPKEVEDNWKEVESAIRKELKSFVDLDVFRVADKGTTGNCMSSRWVLRWKVDSMTNLRTLKARLTIRGFLDKQQYGLETYAGTASRWGQRLVVAISVQQG